MTYSINGFLGGDMGDFTPHADTPTTISAENRGFCTSVLYSLGGWFYRSTQQGLDFLDLLPTECTVLIFQHLPLTQTGNVAAVCQRAYQVTQIIYFQQARQWGYEGTDAEKGSIYLKGFVRELKSAELPYRDQKTPNSVVISHPPELYTTRVPTGVVIGKSLPKGENGRKELFNRNLTVLQNLDGDLILSVFFGYDYQGRDHNHPKGYVVPFCIKKGHQILPLEKDQISDFQAKINIILMKALYEGGNKKLILFALQHGADPNYVGPRGWTPCHSCMYTRDEEIVLEFVQHGANWLIPNEHGNTPLSITNSWYSDCFPDEGIAKILKIIKSSLPHS